MESGNTAASADEVVAATRAWLEKAVIGLNLCTFASAAHVGNQIRYAVSDAQTPEALFADLARELQTLAAADPAQVETTLLIHPRVLDDPPVAQPFDTLITGMPVNPNSLTMISAAPELDDPP